ncbi:MAG: FxLYD domain-containing protein [Phycisphaerales bacterium]
MGRTLVITLLAASSLFTWGCAGSSQANRVSGPVGKSSPCLQQDGFAVLYFRAFRDNYGSISVVGEVKNVGSAARGVELQAALRDAGGRLIAVGHFCPASYKNIAPGETWPFSYSFGRQQDIDHAEMRIVGAFRTLDVLSGPR